MYATAYLRRHLPTFTLSKGTTPYEVMTGSKPSYEHLHVWGYQAYPIDPAETRGKGENMRYEAIFVCYEENRIGWGCVNLNGRYRFTNDVIFDESAKGRLGNHSCRPFANPMASTQKTICKLYGHLDTEAWHSYSQLYGISAQFKYSKYSQTQ